MSFGNKSIKDRCISLFSFIKSCLPNSDSKKKISAALSRQAFFRNALHNIMIDQRPFPRRERDYNIFPGLNVETEMVVRIGHVFEITRMTMRKIFGAIDPDLSTATSTGSSKHIKERDIDPYVNVLCELIPELLTFNSELSEISKNQQNVRDIIESFAFDLLEYEDIDYKDANKMISDEEYVSRMENVLSGSPSGNKKWLYIFKASKKGGGNVPKI